MTLLVVSSDHKIVSKMTYNVSSGTVNPTTLVSPVCLVFVCLAAEQSADGLLLLLSWKLRGEFSFQQHVFHES